MGKDAQDPFCLAQLHHLVSSVNPANSVSEHVAKVSAAFVYQHTSSWARSEWLHCTCSPDVALCSCRARHGVLNVLQDCINPGSFPFPALPQSHLGLPGSPLCLETKRGIRCYELSTLLFGFFLLSLLFLQKSEPLKWFKFFLAIWGLGFWPRRNVAALSWSWQNLHRNASCSPFLLWKWTSFLCV